MRISARELSKSRGMEYAQLLRIGGRSQPESATGMCWLTDEVYLCAGYDYAVTLHY